MKSAWLLLPLSLLLAACITPASIRQAASEARQQLDTDRDGSVSSRELKDGAGNMTLWLQVLSILLAGGGTVLGVTGTAGAARANRQVDELYDATHRPIASSEAAQNG